MAGPAAKAARRSESAASPFGELRMPSRSSGPQSPGRTVPSALSGSGVTGFCCWGKQVEVSKKHWATSSPKKAGSRGRVLLPVSLMPPVGFICFSISQVRCGKRRKGSRDLSGRDSVLVEGQGLLAVKERRQVSEVAEQDIGRRALQGVRAEAVGDPAGPDAGVAAREHVRV